MDFIFIKKIILFYLLAIGFLVFPNSSWAQPVGEGCGGMTNTFFPEQCDPWEKPVPYTDGVNNYTICMPTPDCIQQPEDHWYYDDPVRRTRQLNENEVTLPTGLAWSDAPGWHDDETNEPWENPNGTTGRQPQKTKMTGINSYIIEIDNKNGLLNEAKSKGDIFRWLVTKPYFNPTDGDLNIPCFFNSDTTYKWRVRPSVGEDGSDTESEERALWWTFHTSPAPEPRFPKDPDWNGPDAATNVNFCQAALEWCAAKVSDAKKPYNQDQDYALSYQIMVHSNENQATSLASSYIPPKFKQYASWLKQDLLGYGPQETCHYLEKQSDGTCKAEIVNPTSAKVPRQYFSNYFNPNNDRNLFTKNILYYWQPRSCFNNSNAGNDSCQKTNLIHYGQKWKFTTAAVPIAPPTLSSPPDDQLSADQSNAIPIGLPVNIAWKQTCGTNSYGYQIQELSGADYKNLLGGEQRTINSQVMFSTASSSPATNASVEALDLKLDTAYRWRVRSCWPSLPLKASDCDTWSSWFNFRTTGRPVKAATMQPGDNSTQVALPVALQWERVPGAFSYLLTLNGKKIPVVKLSNADQITYQLTYPQITQNQNYTWKMQTCANPNATLCGAASGELSFGTASLGTPTNNQHPDDKETIYSQDLPLSYAFIWNAAPGANYYHFVLTYTDKSAQETSSDCATGEKANVYVERQNSYSVSNSLEGIFCLGSYKWTVQACMDSECKDAGPVSPDWTFKLDAGNAPKSSGLMVCGQAIDDPNTPFDERETCQPKHFLLMIQRIINFILFKLAFWLLPILAVITGVIFYKSLGGPEIWETIKSWWRAIGIGYLLIFFAWIIVGIMLRVFGYTSAWWKI